MNFDFSEDQKLLQQTARDYLEANAPLSVAREVLESSKPYAEDLWKGAAELGWLGATIPESYGGAGFGHLELCVIAEEVGRSLAPIPFASSVYLLTEALLLAGSDAQKNRLLPKLAAGEAIGCFALAERTGQNGLAGLTTTFSGGVVKGTKLPVLDGDVADTALVVAQGDSGPCLVLVDLNGNGVTRKSVKSIDPSRSVAQIEFDGAPGELLGDAAGEALIARLLDRAAVLLAFEQLGGATRAFELTREFTMGRYAFGRPIASFQAVKHRLADRWCDIELARSNSYYGAWALSTDAEELPVAACLSRVSASTAYDAIGIEMIQLHGGVGFTWEYDCHLFYRRAKLSSLVLGSPSHWRDLLIDRLEAQRAA
ncbi:MAG: acyl-CoA/acyl-ACP dehydrogenase [Proteobacteria bacterium]|nr:acyl-CoA/acyl-ACP dehydrogenase [Pseudomonadota bacterium]